MNSKVVGVVAFLTGAAVGVFATWRVLKEQYERRAEEDIQSVREMYARRGYKIDNDKSVEEPTEVDYEAVKEVNKQLVADLGYDSAIIEKNEENEKKGEPIAMDKPYVIDPMDSGNGGEYEIVSLTYYSDGVLVDESGEPIEDMESMIGVNPLDHFGEYEDDSVFVRDDDLRIDYEILRDFGTYAETLNSPPRKG
jgi:uncharacterized protein YneF (UPF0154 family)